MDMRNWLAIIILVGIALIVADGLRKKRSRNTIRLKLDDKIPSGPGEDFSSELPSGGARVRPRGKYSNDPLDDDGDDDYDLDDYDQDDYDQKQHERDDQDEYDEDSGPVFAEDGSGRIEPSFGADDEDMDDLEEVDNEALTAERDDAPRHAMDYADSASRNRIPAQIFQNELPLDDDELESLDAQEGEEAEEVIVINVMSKSGEQFQGKEMVPVLKSLGLRLGNMSIFHRHSDVRGNGPIMFSMVNMVKPGTFEMAAMDTFSTPGVSLFMQLPSQVSHMECFERMLEAANTLRDTLGGELKDEQRSVLTRQTIEHCRQRIHDFELTQLSRK